jgi:hypothetical protein
MWLRLIREVTIVALPCNSWFYDKMTDEDIEWLKEQLPEDTFERKAITGLSTNAQQLRRTTTR